MPGAPFTAYQNVQASTADPGRLVLLLFDGALRFLGQALAALKRGDTADFVTSQSRAHAIIAELSNSLDRETGADIAESLDRLYAFMLVHLTQGLAAGSRKHLEDVLRILQTLRDAFEGALEAHRRGA